MPYSTLSYVHIHQSHAPWRVLVTTRASKPCARAALLPLGTQRLYTQQRGPYPESGSYEELCFS